MVVRVSLHDVQAVSAHHLTTPTGRALSSVLIEDGKGSEVTLFVTRAQADAIAAAFRPTCDQCGEAGEIRAIPQQYGGAPHLCATCFAKQDPENSFTDFPQAEEAA